MVAGLAFHYEPDTVIPSELGLWDSICNAFEMYPFTIDETGHYLTRKCSYKSIKDAFEDNRDKIWIYLAPERSIPGSPDYVRKHNNYIPLKYEYLHELVHPRDNVIYVIGPDNGGLYLPEIEIRPIDKVVTIRHARPMNELYAIIAGHIVAYDRWFKNGSKKVIDIGSKKS